MNHFNSFQDRTGGRKTETMLFCHFKVSRVLISPKLASTAPWHISLNFYAKLRLIDNFYDVFGGENVVGGRSGVV